LSNFLDNAGQGSAPTLDNAGQGPAPTLDKTSGNGSDLPSRRPPHGGTQKRTMIKRLIPPRVVYLWITIVIIGLVFSQLNDAFLSGGNLLGLLRSGSTLGIVALGELLVIVAAEIDLSVGAVYVLAPVVLSVLWIDHRLPFLVAVAGALAVTAAVGMLNALLAVTGRIPAFIVTLGTLSLVNGLSIILSGSGLFTPTYADPPLPAGEIQQFANIGGAKLGPIPIQLVWIAVIAVVLFVALHWTVFGFRLTALGGNESAAKFARLRVKGYKYAVFTIAALLAGLAGIVDFSFLQSSQPTSAGDSLTFPVFAAVIIGGASLSGGVGTVIGTLTGAVLLTEIGNGLALVGVSAGPQLMFTGAITIAAVGLDQGSRFLPRIKSWLPSSRSTSEPAENSSPAQPGVH
jgi:ribose/xylose/arabinose/galactoside ABC-type transport system permease subunit